MTALPDKRAMLNRTLNILLSCALVISCNVVRAQEAPPKKCAYDHARLLALDENQFDQDMSGGWRQLSSIPGCARVAADVLHDYREAHHIESGLLFWHEAQVRAQDGQYPEAIALMKRAYKSPEEDKAGWNLYVDDFAATAVGQEQPSKRIFHIQNATIQRSLLSSIACAEGLPGPGGSAGSCVRMGGL